MAILVACDAHNFINMMSVHKGVIWLLVSTVAKVPPVVRFEYLPRDSHLCPSAIHVTLLGTHLFEYRWYFFFLSVAHR
jgi:hypothetical protein